MKIANITICFLLGMTFIIDVQAEEAKKNQWQSLYKTIHKKLNLPTFLNFSNNELEIPFINKTHTWGGRDYDVYTKSYKELGINTQIDKHSFVGFAFNHKKGRIRSEKSKITGMKAIDKAPTANLFFHYEDDNYTGTVSMSKGLLSKNTGLVISTGFGYNSQISEKISTSATLNVNWADKNYVDGALKLSNSIPEGEQVHSGNSSIINYGLRASAHYQVETKHSLQVNTSIGTISKSDENSVIDRDIQASLVFGYKYKF